jgi:alkylation response protein AidB-like acyl-CoA dehydrogenase
MVSGTWPGRAARSYAAVVINEAARILAAYAEQTEERERPAEESLAAVRAAGGFALSGVSTERMAQLLAEWGRGCPSTAWIAGTCATSKLLVRRAFGERAQRELFADPDVLTCGSGNPGGQGQAGPEGVRVTGRWPNVSGCEDATWAGLALMADGVFSIALIPVADLRVEHTWRMAGMRGTGSHTLIAGDVLVPAYRVTAMSPPAPADQLRFVFTVLGPMVGAARGALDQIETMFASARKPFMTAYTRMGESPGARGLLAEAAYLVRRAERAMTAVARAVDAEPVTGDDRIRLRMDLSGAAADCRAAVGKMLDLYGSSGFAMDNPLQRFWRDLEVGSRHPLLNAYLTVEDYGRSLAPA